MSEGRTSDGRRRGAARASRGCPICGQPAQPDFLPFCSKRCADVDLHRWLSGSYRIPGPEDERSDSGEESG